MFEFLCACFREVSSDCRTDKMADTSDFRNISKFNGLNYQLWKFQMRTGFVVHDLLDIVEGREIKPDPVAEQNAEKSSKWIRNDAKAMFFLSASMEYNQLECLVTCSSAHEMWNKLSSIHEQMSATNKLALTTKFHKYRMAAGDAIPQHVAKVENLASSTPGHRRVSLKHDGYGEDIEHLAGQVQRLCFSMDKRRHRRTDVGQSERKVYARKTPNDHHGQCG